MADKAESIVFGGGCFWCVEAAFRTVDGVIATAPGYAGGTTLRPSYNEVCAGHTGHAEVVRVEFDPEKVSLRELLEVFFEIHDPTSLNRQGADVGPQYRSIVLYEKEQQRAAVEAFIRDASSRYDRPIVTEVRELETFWPAEESHFDYYARHPRKPYCQVVIAPKLRKLKERRERMAQDRPGD